MTRTQTRHRPNHGLKVRVTRAFSPEFMAETEAEAYRLRMPHAMFLEMLWAYWKSAQGPTRSEEKWFREKVEGV